MPRPQIETAEYYNTETAKRLLKAFDEAGYLTLAGMLGAYDQWRESQEFYYNIIIKTAGAD